VSVVLVLDGRKAGGRRSRYTMFCLGGIGRRVDTAGSLVATSCVRGPPLRAPLTHKFTALMIKVVPIPVKATDRQRSFHNLAEGKMGVQAQRNPHAVPWGSSSKK